MWIHVLVWVCELRTLNSTGLGPVDFSVFVVSRYNPPKSRQVREPIVSPTHISSDQKLQTSFLTKISSYGPLGGGPTKWGRTTKTLRGVWLPRRVRRVCGTQTRRQGHQHLPKDLITLRSRQNKGVQLDGLIPNSVWSSTFCESRFLVEIYQKKSHIFHTPKHRDLLTDCKRITYNNTS